jgi:hypothetical protein
MNHDNARHQAENDDMEQRFRTLIANPEIPLEQPVRIARSVGAVLIVFRGMSELFGEGVTTTTLAELVRSRHAAREQGVEGAAVDKRPARLSWRRGS